MQLKKYSIALTGLFLCLFLLVHVSANLILLLPESSAQYLYNAYAHRLRESFAIKAIAMVLYLSIVIHVLMAFFVTRWNKAARPQNYAVHRSHENSSWASRHMGHLGVLVLIFMAVHLFNFWMKIKLGLFENLSLDAHGHMDVYQAVKVLFQNTYYVVFYAVLMVPLGFHLHHGIISAFKTLGVYRKNQLNLIALLASVYTWMICLAFAFIPIYMYWRG